MAEYRLDMNIMPECALYLKWRGTNDVFHALTIIARLGLGQSWAVQGRAEREADRGVKADVVIILLFCLFCSDLFSCCSIYVVEKLQQFS
jgi:hypothetical protein